MRWVLRSVLMMIGLLLMASIVVFARPSPQENLFELFLLNLRGDIELLAAREFGGGVRPEGWNGTLEVSSPSMLADLWVDNQLLGESVFGGTLPMGWIGATSRNPELVARNIRHDLELSADAFFGEDTRPDNWAGSIPLYRCERSIMNLVYALDVLYNVQSETPESVINYCATLAAELENLVPETIGAQIEEGNIPTLVLAVRGDLERLADEVLGLNNRPGGWIGNKDINSPNLVGDIFSDLERLADDRLGQGNRPPDWISSLTGSQTTQFRNLRFNLELLTDVTLGDDVRPRGWQGENPLLRCTPATQNLVFLVEQAYDYTVPDLADRGSDEFCNLVDAQANNLIENPPVPEGDPDVAVDERFVAESRLAFSYLDRAALQYMGTMPFGVEFRAWYRNFGESTMMFVSGQDFALYVDRRFTSLPQDVFERLPTLEGVRPLTFCDAGWCNGPRPTPTPTGSGILLDIITAGTPPPSPIPTNVPGEEREKTLINWNSIRVEYRLQRPDVGRAQVTIELCRDANQIACEPATRVFDNTTNQEVPTVGRISGLNVYELPYGYSTNYTIESQNFISNDIWLNDPAATGDLP